MNGFERDFIAEVKACLKAGRPVSRREKQMVLDILAREGGVMSSAALARAKTEGYNVSGIKTT